MGFLTEHFQKRAAILAQGLPIHDGLYFDVQGTLLLDDPTEIFKKNPDLWAFAQWNNKHRFLGPNHIFSTHPQSSAELLNDFNLEIADIGVSDIEAKFDVYGAIDKLQNGFNIKSGFTTPAQYKAAHMINLLIDDDPRNTTGFAQTSLVLNWWNPTRDDFQAFLKSKTYLNFRP